MTEHLFFRNFDISGKKVELPSDPTIGDYGVIQGRNVYMLVLASDCTRARNVYMMVKSEDPDKDGKELKRFAEEDMKRRKEIFMQELADYMDGDEA